MSEEELHNPFAGNAEAAKEGKEIFLRTGCYACHGHEAEGAVGPDLTDDEWIYQPTDAMIFNTINRGRPGTLMAPFGDQLKPDEIWKIVEFLRDKNRQRHAKEQK
jgi:cytochrome c-L